jgi:hypothetical protein
MSSRGERTCVAPWNNLNLFFLGNNHVPEGRSFFSFKNMVTLWSNLSLAILETWLFLRGQLKPFFILAIYFHPFRESMKKIIQEKIQT